MPTLALPPDVEAVFHEYFTCEFTTVNKQGEPLTWPTLPYYDQSEGRFILTASIAFALKTYNARRHPQVSLLFSDPTGSQLPDPPAVLVQGDTTVSEVVDASPPAWSREIFKLSIRRQPDSRKFIASRLARRLFLFYFQRIALFVTPRRMLVWPQRDFTLAPTQLELRYVE
jgi:hypothetical protein